MAQSISDIMTRDPKTLQTTASIQEAATAMRDADAGAIIVTEEGRFAGLVTDRDIVVRGLADGKGADATVGEVYSSDVQSVSSDQTVDDAIAIVRTHNVRRVPVVDDGKPVGIVSIGDLAIERDEGSALADLSSSPANN